VINIGTLFGLLTLRDEFTPVLQHVESTLASTGSKLGVLGGHIQSAGRTLLPLTAGLALVGGASIKMATDLNASLANVSAILTELSGPQLDRVVGEMKTKVQGLAVEFGQSTSDISGGLYEVISSLGYTNDTFSQLETSARAGAAGLSTTKEAFNFLSAVTKTYGDTSEAAFKKAADLGFQAVNFGQTTFPELAEAIGGVAPIAKVAGVSMQEMFAVIATATGVTGNTSEVVTQMASAMNGLLNPSKHLKEMYESIGVSSGEALIQQKGFAGALQEVAKYAEATGTPMIELLGRKEGFILTASLAGEQAKTMALNLDRMGQAYEANGGIVAAAFEKQTQGINKAGFAFEQFKARVEVAAQRLGDVLLPIIMRAADQLMPLWLAVERGVQWFAQLPQPIQTAAVALAGLVALAGPLLMMFGSFVSLVGTAVDGMASLAGGAMKVSKWWKALAFESGTLATFAAMLTRTWAQLTITLGATGVFGRIVTWWKALSYESGPLASAAALITRNWYRLTIAFESMMAIATGLGTTLMSGLGAALVFLATPLGLVIVAVTALTAVLITMADAWDDVWQFLKDVGTIAGWVAGVIGGGLVSAFWTVVGVVKEFLSACFDLVDFMSFGLLGKLKELAGYLVDKFAAAWDVVAGAVKSALKFVRDEVHNVAETIRMDLSGAIAQAEKGIEPFRKSMADDLAKNALPPVTAGLRLFEAQLDATANATRRATEADKEYAQEIAKLRGELTGATAASEANKYMDALKGVDELQRLNQESLEGLATTLAAGIAGYRQMGKEAPAAMVAMSTKVQAATREVKRMNDEIDSALSAASGLGNVFAEDFKRMNDEVESAILASGRLGGAFYDMSAAIDPRFMRDLERMDDEIESALSAADGLGNVFADDFQRMNDEIDSAILASGRLGGAFYDTGAIVKDTTKETFGLKSALGGAADILDGINSKFAQTAVVALRAAEAVISNLAEGDVFGAVVAAATAGIQLLGDALHKSAGEDVMERVGRAWGIAITEEMGDAIAETAKNMFRGNRQAAEIFHLGDILEAAGGLNDGNFEKFVARLRDTFVMLETGAFTAGEAVTVLDDNFAAFAEHATQHGQLVTKEFQEIIHLAEQAGLRVAAIDDFVKEQVSTAVTGLEALLKPGLAALDTLKQIKELKDAASGQSGEELGQTLDKIKELERQAAAMGAVMVTTQEAAAGLGASLFASFAALTEHGAGPLEAIRQLTPAIDSLQQQLLAAGIDGGAAFGTLQAMAALAADEIAGPLVDAMHGGGQALLGLHNAGMLNQEMFTGLTTQISRTFQALVAQGKDGQAAMVLIAPEIQRIWELQQDFGYAVDASTQLLIDQAEQAGLVGDAHRSAQDKAVKAMQDAATAMEDLADTIREAFGLAGDASEDFAGQVRDAVGSIPDNPFGGWQLPSIDLPTVPDSYWDQFIPPDTIMQELQTNLPSAVDAGWVPYPEIPDMPVVPMAAGGAGTVSRPTLFLAGEAGREDFAFSGANRQFAAPAPTAPSTTDATEGRRGGDTHVHVHGDVRVSADDPSSFARNMITVLSRNTEGVLSEAQVLINP
jgi:TP901 family phage tail tape measure protein